MSASLYSYNWNEEWRKKVQNGEWRIKWLIFGDQKVDQGMVLVVGESATRVRSCSCVDFGSRIASVRVFSRISAEDE